jgi:hypothetical protein
MKKAIYRIMGTLLSFPLFIRNTFAIGVDDFSHEVYRPENLPTSGNGSASSKIADIINFFIDLILYAAGGLAVLMLVIGSIMLITSLGNEERSKKGKDIIKYALIGLFSVILAYALVTNIIDLVLRSTS